MNESSSDTDWPNIVGGGCACGLLGAFLGCVPPVLWAFVRDDFVPRNHVNGADYGVFDQMFICALAGFVFGLLLGMLVAFKRCRVAQTQRDQNEPPIAKP